MRIGSLFNSLQTKKKDENRPSDNGGLFSLHTKWKNHSHDSVKYTVLQGEKQYIFVKS